MVLSKEAVDTKEEFARVVEYFEGLADEAGINLIVDADGIVVADRSLLRRAVSNLVANAIRFTPQGGTISIVAKAIANDYVIRV